MILFTRSEFSFDFFFFYVFITDLLQCGCVIVRQLFCLLVFVWVIQMIALFRSHRKVISNICSHSFFKPLTILGFSMRIEKVSRFNNIYVRDRSINQSLISGSGVAFM